jgi:hypothetical protein
MISTFDRIFGSDQSNNYGVWNDHEQNKILKCIFL